MAKLKASAVDYWLSEDGLLLLECWARDGYSLGMIADKMGIYQSVLTKWKKEYPKIAKALSKGKEVVDYKVENSLLKSALGFTLIEETVTIGRQQKSGEWFDIIKETKKKEVAPNVTAILAWLNNRKPDAWKRNRDNVVEVDDEDSDVKITIVRGDKNDLDDNVHKEATIDQKDIQKEKKKQEKKKDEWDGWEDW